jgi:hypothetical protein
MCLAQPRRTHEGGAGSECEPRLGGVLADALAQDRDQVAEHQLTNLGGELKAGRAVVWGRRLPDSPRQNRVAVAKSRALRPGEQTGEQIAI